MIWDHWDFYPRDSRQHILYIKNYGDFWHIIDLPTFNSQLHIQALLNWLIDVEYFFDYIMLEGEIGSPPVKRWCVHLVRENPSQPSPTTELAYPVMVENEVVAGFPNSIELYSVLKNSTGCRRHGKSHDLNFFGYYRVRVLDKFMAWLIFIKLIIFISTY